MLERESLEQAFEPGVEVQDFLRALVGYLAAPCPSRARFEKLCAAARALGLPAEASWPMVTFFPFVALPSRNVLLLPRAAGPGASRLGCDLRYQETPNWATYVRLRDLSSRLLEKLAPSGARDHVDVECFLHATGARRGPAAAGRATAVPRIPRTKVARASRRAS
jgi:hypothetical protein